MALIGDIVDKTFVTAAIILGATIGAYAVHAYKGPKEPVKQEQQVIVQPSRCELIVTDALEELYPGKFNLEGRKMMARQECQDECVSDIVNNSYTNKSPAYVFKFADNACNTQDVLKAERE